MRRAGVLVAQLAARAGVAEQAMVTTAGTSSMRCFAAAAEPPKIVPNPLQQIVPPIIKAAGVAAAGVRSGVSAAVDGLINGPATRGAITYVADALLSGKYVDAENLDLPKWAAWLAHNGYSNKAGWDTIMEGVKAVAPRLQPAEVEALIPALNKVGRYDRELFATFADIIKARFTEFETPGLAASLPVYAAHDYFDAALWDDVADAITYANHYLAPSRTPLTDLAALYSAYAKYEVDRGDLFVCLARGIHEDRLKGLPAEELRAVVGGFLGAWKALNFYPDATEALLVAARLNPGAMGPAENALISDVEAALRANAPGGKLAWLDGGYKDSEHFHGSAFGSYNLWVMRESLVSQYYKPSDISPRVARAPLPVTPGASESASVSA